MVYTSLPPTEIAWMAELQKKADSGQRLTEEEFAEVLALIKEYELPVMPGGYCYGFYITIHNHIDGQVMPELLTVSSAKLPSSWGSGSDMGRVSREITHTEKNKALLIGYDFPELKEPWEYEY